MIINESLGAWSQLFVLLAAMTYLVAFVAFAWDMASHSKPLRRAPAPTAEQQDPVGAGGRLP